MSFPYRRTVAMKEYNHNNNGQGDHDQRSVLMADERFARLRHEYDQLASDAIDKLYEILSSGVSSGCPVPRSDLFAALEQHHPAHPVLHELWKEIESVPSWVDWDQIQRGQRFFYRYAVANMLGFALQGFIGENVAAFGPAEVLVRTGGLSQKTLIKRVLETFQWVLEASECLESIKPGGKGHASTIRVRLLHASVRERITRLANEKPTYFDTAKLGVPINSYDSILTVTFFCCNPIWVQLPQLGIRPHDTEIEDFVAFYRYLSYLLGSPSDYFNSGGQAKATMSAMLARKQPPSESSRNIAHAFIDCLADSPPFFLSRNFIYAGCRHFNSSELCDQLGIGRTKFLPYIMFQTVCWITYLLSVAQKADSRIDDYFVTVSFQCIQLYVLRS